ncbi:hypothetical protein [Thermorudis peleae]|uniref:hypothetical protein n=1 Tax=Thermorudis peleae TaxID=1382356 RepID=UPI00068D9A70|nr:hypothetical protein [Thermorudis peleae]
MMNDRRVAVELASSTTRVSSPLWGWVLALVLLPFVVAVAFAVLGQPLLLSRWLLGVVGWLVALALRGPVILLVRRLAQRAQQWAVIAASGPAEELVRLAVVRYWAASLPAAINVGQGWAGIEVWYAALSLVLTTRILRRQDEQAQSVRQALAELGLLQASPAFGLIERLAATAFHIGCTLLLAASPWWVLLTVPLHSALNLLVMRLIRRSVALAEALALVVGLLVGVIGWLSWH